MDRKTIDIPAMAVVALWVTGPALAASMVVTPDSQPSPEQTLAVNWALEAGDRGQPFTIGEADVSGDGRPDIIARFNSGMYCGSLGCSGLVVLATDKGHALHAIMLPNFQEKVTVLGASHFGMHDLRFDDAEYIFKWNGKTYR